MGVFILWPPPSSVIGWFTLFQENALVGLLNMDLLLIVDYLLLIGVFSALWASLRRANESLMAIALILQLVATATYLASTVAFEMLTLSNQYATRLRRWSGLFSWQQDKQCSRLGRVPLLT